MDKTAKRRRKPTETDADDVLSPYADIITSLARTRRMVEVDAPTSREKSLVLTKIDEAAMWVRQIPGDFMAEKHFNE